MERLHNLLNRLTQSRYVPYAVLFFSIASFGILIPSLGYYWDDWPMIWVGQLAGSSGYMDALAGDRPFLAGIYLLTTNLLGSAPIQWHILALVSRWLTAFSLWWMLNQLWPGHEERVAWVVLLFAVYPGFKQQPIAVIYANGFFLLTAQFLSFGLMLQAVKTGHKYWLLTLLGMVSLAACAFSTEYYIGLEMIRPLLLWIVLTHRAGTTKSRLLQVLRHWAPYLAVLIVYLIWRVFIFSFPTYQPDTLGALSTAPLQAFIELLNDVIQGIFAAAWQAWSSTFRFPSLTEFNAKSALLSWAIIISISTLAILYLWRLHPALSAAPEKHPSTSWSKQALALGGITLLFSGAPYWITGLPVQLRFPWDRFTLSFMLGSALFLAGLIDWLLRTRSQKVILLGLIIGMASGANFDTANSFRRDWLVHNDFFWQLTWRAPALKPGTSLLTYDLPLNYYSDNSLTAPLNWIYAPDNHTDSIPYYLGFTSVRLGQSIPALEKDLPIYQTYRGASFDSTTSQALVFFYSPPGCLKVIDPRYNADLPIYPDSLREAFRITHPDQILAETTRPVIPPAHIFGNEPVHTWCYYYQKADLARQAQDWETLVAVAEQGFAEKYYPEELSELYPFIEGYAQTGNWPRALELAADVKILGAPNLIHPTCTLLKRLSSETSPTPDLQQEFDRVWFETLHCNDYYPTGKP